MGAHIGRRRLIVISAAAGALTFLPSPASHSAPRLAEWTGPWLGGVATIRLYVADLDWGEQLLRRVVAEARRWEAIFSLYRTDSVLSELNRSGVLVAPPHEFVDLLRHCDSAWSRTGGVFDPTVQPLWQCYAGHFSQPVRASGPPLPEVIERALSRVGWPRVRFSLDRVVLEPGMALTLNGVVQGYMTDRVVDMLRATGLTSCLVDMGEIRTLGVKPSGRPWQVAVGLPNAGRSTLPAHETIDRAVATSSAEGFMFDDGGACNHLFDPATGRCADAKRTLTVVAPTATEADALSTAFILMDEARIARTLARCAAVKAFLSTGSAMQEIAAASH